MGTSAEVNVPLCALGKPCALCWGRVETKLLRRQYNETSLTHFQEDGSSAGGGSVHIVNLKHLSDMEVVSPSSSSPSSPPPLPEINFDKVRKRLEQNLAARWKEVRTRGVNVSPQAQALFDFIRKQ